MPQFTDRKGNEWTIELTVGMVEQLHTDADFNLDDVIEKPDSVGALLSRSPKQMGQVLWVLCEEQAKAKGIDPRAFAYGFDRPALDRAVDAILGAILTFYPPREAAGRAIRDRLPEFLAKMDAEIMAKVGIRLEAELSGTATALPESAASAIPVG